jgi:hypothetical protein
VKQRESERLRICRNGKNGFSAEVLTAGKTMQICLIIALDALKDAVSSCGHLEGDDSVWRVRPKPSFGKWSFGVSGAFGKIFGRV